MDENSILKEVASFFRTHKYGFEATNALMDYCKSRDIDCRIIFE